MVKTIIPNNDVTVGAWIQIPANDPPGLYWYHPHPHGFSAPRVYGGAAGALIIEGTNSLTQGLPERVLIVRRNVDAVTDDDSKFSLISKPLTPRTRLPIINMTGGQSEF